MGADCGPRWSTWKHIAVMHRRFQKEPRIWGHHNTWRRQPILGGCLLQKLLQKIVAEVVAEDCCRSCCRNCCRSCCRSCCRRLLQKIVAEVVAEDSCRKMLQRSCRDRASANIGLEYFIPLPHCSGALLKVEVSEAGRATGATPLLHLNNNVA